MLKRGLLSSLVTARLAWRLLGSRYYQDYKIQSLPVPVLYSSQVVQSIWESQACVCRTVFSGRVSQAALGAGGRLCTVHVYQSADKCHIFNGDITPSDEALLITLCMQILRSPKAHMLKPPVIASSLLGIPANYS